MSFIDEAEKLAGAVIAVEGLKKVDPNAGFLAEGAAAIAGFEGTGAIKEHFEKEKQDNEATDEQS